MPIQFWQVLLNISWWIECNNQANIMGETDPSLTAIFQYNLVISRHLHICCKNKAVCCLYMKLNTYFTSIFFILIIIYIHVHTNLQISTFTFEIFFTCSMSILFSIPSHLFHFYNHPLSIVYVILYTMYNIVFINSLYQFLQ